MRPNDPNTLDSRALAFLKLGHWSAAIADYDTVLSIKPDLASALYGRGIARRRGGDDDGAARDIAAARAINAEIAETFVSYDVR